MRKSFPKRKEAYSMFVCLFGFLTSSSTTRLYRGRAPRQERLTILRAATHETELGDHDFCLSRSHYTDTDPTCREWAATAGIEPGTSSMLFSPEILYIYIYIYILGMANNKVINICASFFLSGCLQCFVLVFFHSERSINIILT